MLERDAEIARMTALCNSSVAFNAEQLLFALIEGADVRMAHRAHWEYFEDICKVPDDVSRSAFPVYLVPADRLPKVQALYQGIVAPGELGQFYSQMLAYICQQFFWRTLPHAEFTAFVNANPLKFPLKFYRDPTDEEWLNSHDFPLFGPSPFTDSIRSVFVQGGSHEQF